MLAAVDAGSIVIVVSIVVFFLLGQFAKRGSRRLRDWLEVRDGRVVLKEDVRLKLARRPRKLRRVEALIAKSYAVNARGEIVPAGSGEETAEPGPESTARAPEPAPESAPAQPDPAASDDRFSSVWEEQDKGPSIWDEKDETAFWGKPGERE